MKKIKKEIKSDRLKKLEKKFAVVEKSKNYLKKEMSKIRKKYEKLGNEITREKQAISLTNKAKNLRIQRDYSQ